MKRRIGFCVVLTGMLLMSACKKDSLYLSDNGKNVLQNAYVDVCGVYVPTKPIEEYADCRAKILSSFTPAPDAEFIPTSVMNEFSSWPETVGKLYRNFDHVVVGEVVDITYSDEGGWCQTYFSFAVTDVLKSDKIQQETIITVLENGGYCRLSKAAEAEYKSTGLKLYGDYTEEEKEKYCEVFTWMGEPETKVGDHFLLFLAEEHNLEHVEGDLYRIGSGYMDKYIMDENGYYARYIPAVDETWAYVENPITGKYDMECPMTLEEIKEAINRAKEGNVGVLQDLSGVTAYRDKEQKVVYTIEADLNHDGIMDTIVSSISYESGNENKTAEELMEMGEVCTIKVYDGADISGETCIYERRLYNTRPGCRQIILVHEDGKDYLMTCDNIERKEQVCYSYTVEYYEVYDENNAWWDYYYNSKNELEESDSVYFKTETVNPIEYYGLPENKENMPLYRKNMEAWFEGATFIAGVDTNDEKKYYISTDEKVYEPEEYFDNVWKRVY